MKLKLLAPILLLAAMIGCQPPVPGNKSTPHVPPPPPQSDTQSRPLDPGEVDNVVRNAVQITQFVPSAKQPAPDDANFGYTPPSKEARQQMLQEMGVKPLAEEAPLLFESREVENQKPDPTHGGASGIRGPPIGDDKPILLYRYLYAVQPGWTVGRQGIGDCVSWGYANAVDILLAISKVEGKSGTWKPAATESIYGGSRVEARGRPEGGGGWSDGSYGAAAAKWCNQWGIIYREPQPTLGIDLTTYSSSLAKQWGNYGNGGRGDNGRLDAIAKQHPVRRVALCRNFDEAAAAITNGYPVPVCSMQGFASTRDSAGFARASGSWAHCMNFIGVRHGDRPGLLCMNSWGTNWISGPKWPEDQPDGSFWVEKSTVNRMLAGEDSFAISNLDGFKPRQLRHAEGW